MAIPASRRGLLILAGIGAICMAVTAALVWRLLSRSRPRSGPRLHSNPPVYAPAVMLVTLGMAFSVGWMLDIPTQYIQRQWQKRAVAPVVLDGILERDGQAWLLNQNGDFRTFRLRTPFGLAEGRLHDGDLAVVQAQALPPEAARNPGSFDERSWMIQKRWAMTLVVERIHVVHTHLPRNGTTERWRAALGTRIDSRMAGADVRALVRAMLLADRSALTPDLESLFRRVGLMHLLAVSGLHFGCIVLGVWLLIGSIVSRLPVPFSIRRVLIPALVVVAAFGYANLVGWSSSVVRAFLMLSVASICRMTHRRGWVERSLLICALIIACVRPEQWYSVGTQLSFAAVAGIALGLRFDRWTRKSSNRNHWPFQSTIIVSTTAFAGTLPVLLWHMGWVPSAGLFVSPPAVALTAATLMLAMAAVILPFGGHTVGLLASIGMQVIVWMAERAHVIGLPHLVTYSPVDIVAALMSAGALSLWSLHRLRVYWKVNATIILVAGASLIWTRPVSPRLTMLDVGQGDALILEGRGFIPVVIDTGPGAQSGRAIAQALQFHGHNQARMMVTHGDRDHTGGLEFLVRQWQMASVMAPWTGDGATKPKLIQLIRGQRLNLPTSMRGYVLHPGAAGRDNHHSIVLLLVRGKHGILLTGDVDMRAEKALLRRYAPLLANVDTRVLKVAHHGSTTSTGLELIDHFPPHIALISAGQDNQFGHPDRDVVARLKASGAIVHQTSGWGAIRISGFGTRLQTHRYYRGRWRRMTPQFDHNPGSVFDENSN